MMDIFVYIPRSYYSPNNICSERDVLCQNILRGGGLKCSLRIFQKLLRILRVRLMLSEEGTNTINQQIDGFRRAIPSTCFYLRMISWFHGKIEPYLLFLSEKQK